jgi:hypothetical protein
MAQDLIANRYHLLKPENPGFYKEMEIFLGYFRLATKDLSFMMN